MTPDRHGREALDALADLLQAKRPTTEMKHRYISASLSFLAEIEQAPVWLRIADSPAFTRVPQVLIEKRMVK